MLPIQVYKTYPYPLHMVKCLGKQHGSKKFSLNIFMKRLSSIIKKRRLKALVWFWIIDETYGLILESKCVTR
jgi:hypothetical protein